MHLSVEHSNDKISKQGRNGKYEQQIDSLTNLYEFNRLINSPGINFRYNKKKLNYSLGTALGFNTYQQKNITTNTGLTKDFVTLMPRASINYKVKANSNLRLNYSGNSQAPSLEQLQPIKNNNDPLNIYEGNPNLKQSFSNNFSLSYNFWNVLKGNNLWSYINYSPRSNAFVNSSTIDRSGLRHYSTVNADGLYNVNWSSSYGIKLKKLDMNIGAGPTGTLSRDVEFINGIKSITNSSSYGLSLNFNKDKEKKYNFWAGPQIRWYHSINSSNKNSEIKYWQVSGNFSGSLMFHKGFEFNLESNFQARQKDPRFPTNSNKMINNAGVKKTFINNTMELSFMVYDVFDQNKGFDRNFTSYNFSETYYTTLKRYAMLSFTWNFSKNGAKPASF